MLKIVYNNDILFFCFSNFLAGFKKEEEKKKKSPIKLTSLQNIVMDADLQLTCNQFD
jgi:hypothetical protein